MIFFLSIWRTKPSSKPGPHGKYRQAFGLLIARDDIVRRRSGECFRDQAPRGSSPCVLLGSNPAALPSTREGPQCCGHSHQLAIARLRYSSSAVSGGPGLGRWANRHRWSAMTVF